MTVRTLDTRMLSYGMTTAQIRYYRPECPAALSLFVWQQYDLAPDFPKLNDFLDHWRREINAALHSISVAHQNLVSSAEMLETGGTVTLQ